MKNMNDFGINTDPPVTIMTLGQVPVMILTNVYRNPDAVRMFAMSQHINQEKGPVSWSFPFYARDDTIFLSVLQQAHGAKSPTSRGISIVHHSRVSRAAMTSKIRRTLPTSMTSVTTSGSLSLSTTEDIPSSAVCGTSLWRHVPTGAEIAPDSESVSQFFTTPDSSWEQTGLVQHRYNQLVIFSATDSHRIDLSGAGPRAIRLTQNFYLITCRKLSGHQCFGCFQVRTESQLSTVDSGHVHGTLAAVSCRSRHWYLFARGLDGFLDTVFRCDDGLR